LRRCGAYPDSRIRPACGNRRRDREMGVFLGRIAPDPFRLEPLLGSRRSTISRVPDPAGD
jgi:hypothetical protein